MTDIRIFINVVKIPHPDLDVRMMYLMEVFRNKGYGCVVDDVSKGCARFETFSENVEICRIFPKFLLCSEIAIKFEML